MNTNKYNKIYSIEFLRIILIFSVVLLHLNLINPRFSYFHTKSFDLAFSVDFLFIIGGFFLHKQISSKISLGTLQHIGKRWLRLAPGVLFCYVILVLAGFQYWGFFPHALSLTMCWGCGPQNVAGGPDWYVGVYFLTSCFFVSIFKKSRDIVWILLILTTIIGWCLQINVSRGHGLDTRDMYYSVLSRHIVRGVTCMGLGMVASYLSISWRGIVIQGGGVLYRDSRQPY